MHGKLGSLSSLVSAPLQRAIENTGVGIVACDADGQMILLSPALRVLFGLDFEPRPMEELPDFFGLLHEDAETPMTHDELPLARARAGEFVKDVVVCARDRRGLLVYLQCNGAPLEDDAGELAGAVLVVQDISAERHARLITEQLRDRLVETVNHEFRTPLAALLGHLEIIREHGYDVTPDLAHSLAAIERAGWRLRDLVCAAAQLIDREEEQHREGKKADGAPLAS